MKEAGIEPVATLFHWSTPQTLEDVGGWLNPASIDAFEEFSRICFDEFGDDVSIKLSILISSQQEIIPSV